MADDPVPGHALDRLRKAAPRRRGRQCTNPLAEEGHPEGTQGGERPSLGTVAGAVSSKRLVARE